MKDDDHDSAAPLPLFEWIREANAGHTWYKFGST
jgi:hypothetical protein